MTDNKPSSISYSDEQQLLKAVEYVVTHYPVSAEEITRAIYELGELAQSGLNPDQIGTFVRNARQHYYEEGDHDQLSQR